MIHALNINANVQAKPTPLIWEAPSAAAGVQGAITDEFQNPITDEFGNPIGYDQ